MAIHIRCETSLARVAARQLRGRLRRACTLSARPRERRLRGQSRDIGKEISHAIPGLTHKSRMNAAPGSGKLASILQPRTDWPSCKAYTRESSIT